MAAGAGNILRTKLTGSSGTAITPGDHLYLTITNTTGDIEIIKVTGTGTSGDALTIARSQDGTTAPAGGWLAGAKISARPVAAIFKEAVLATTAAAVTYAGGGIPAGTVEEALDAAQPYHANLAAEAGLTGAADKLAYYTGAGAKALTNFLAWGRTFLAAADISAARTALGVVAATDTTAGLVEKATAGEMTGAGTADKYPDAELVAAEIDARIAAAPSGIALVGSYNRLSISGAISATLTGISADAKRVVLILDDLYKSTLADLRIQFTSSGGSFTSPAYFCSSLDAGSASPDIDTAGVLLMLSNNRNGTGNLMRASLVFTRISSTDDIWSCTFETVQYETLGGTTRDTRSGLATRNLPGPLAEIKILLSAGLISGGFATLYQES
jgi:hypothetical protein